MNLQHFFSKSLPDPDFSFFQSDQFPLDDEAIADIAVNAMLLVMNNATRSIANGSSTTIHDYAPLVAYGVRFPWRERIALAHQVDTVNDDVPRYACIGLVRPRRRVFAQAVTMSALSHQDVPKSARSTLCGATSVFRVSWLTGWDGLPGSLTDDKAKDIETVVEGGFAGLMRDGRTVGSTESGRLSGQSASMLAYIISMHNDRRYFWEVSASEPFADGFDAKAMFSVDESYIKSLFYARSLPMTASGRLRPILHWVSAHKRRLERGVDIDVRKHLRGIDAFAMHGTRFRITEPRKLAMDAAA